MKKSTLFFVVFALAAGLFYLYAKGYILADFPSISPKEAYEKIRKNPQMPILDVRTSQEFKEGHLQGARLVPLQRLNTALQSGELNDLKGKAFLVYCHSGMRSAAACRILRKAGLKPINMRGGISAWESEKLPIER